MSQLDWHDENEMVVAASALHDDGLPFEYRFKKFSFGWENLTESELIMGPCDAIFSTLAEAKKWAEKNEEKATK